MNASGCSSPRSGCCQRISASAPTIAPSRAHLRLEVQHELVARQRLRQLALGHQGCVRGAGHRRVEELEVRATACLGEIHRRVGVLDQLVGGGAVVREHRDADRRRDRDRAPLGVDRHFDRGQQLGRHLLDLAPRRHAGQQHHELVAAEARDQVGRAQAVGEPRGHGGEQRVADEVAERVVDALEVVEVDEQQRQPRALAARQLHEPLELVVEARAVGQAGERVVVREVVDALLGRVAVADVAHDGHAQPLAVAHHRAHDELHVDARAVLVHDHALVRGLLARGDDRGDLGHVVGRDEVQRAPPEDLLQRVADQLQRRRVGVGDEAVLVEHDAFAAGLHELGQPLLRLAHQLLGEAVLGDVRQQHEAAAHAALAVEMRHEMRLDPARRAVRAGNLALVAHRHALGDHAVDQRLDALARRLADHLGQAAADDRLLGEAEGLRVRAVGEHAAEVVQLVVGDQRRHVVGHQAQQVGRRLQPGRRRVGRFVLGLRHGVHGGGSDADSSTRRARHRSSHERALSSGLRSR